MDIKRLLDIKVIDTAQIQKVLNNRKELITGKEDFLDIEFFKKMVSIDFPIINYYSGEIDSVNKLIPFSNSSNIVIFPSDVIEIEEKNNRVVKYHSQMFFTHILDSLAHYDGLMVPDHNKTLNIYNIKKVKIIEYSQTEIDALVSNIETINIDKDSKAIEAHLVELVNNIHSIYSNPEPKFKNFNHFRSVMYIKGLNEYDLKRLAIYLDAYVKDRSIFPLLEAIKIISEFNN
jgi:hypothetical protein